MKKVIILNKKEGKTPLQALDDFRAQNKSYKDIKMTYAGRLDPLVSGLLLLLAGDKIKEKENYLGLSKEYLFDVLFGFSTDTHDVLGKVQHSHILKNVGMLSRKDLERKIKDNLKYFIGEFVQEYPMYSSKTVGGKPLFVHARNNNLVKKPKHIVSVASLKFIKIKSITANNLLLNIKRRIALVRGDFRQEEILKIWNKKLKNEGDKFFVVSFRVKCGSGMYVRKLAHDLGERMGTPALAFRIKRTMIGKWKL